MGTMTTDRRRRPGFRLRVFGILAVVLIGAAAAGFVLQRALLRARLDRQVEQAHDQELEELQQLAGGRDPATGQPFGGDVAAIFDTFLGRNVPGPGEVFVTFIDGRLHDRSRSEHRLDAALLDRWRATTEGARGWADTPGGRLRWLAAPLDDRSGTAGVFVVATFVEPQEDEIDATLRIEAVVSAIVLAVALAVAWTVASRLLRPVRQLTENADRLDETDLSARIPEQGDDEIARLARAYNAMLDRLQGAFETQRRFIDDAGHELRTPITIVRGHLELMGDDPDERRETVDLVTDELDRMARIVDDLLVLARAEQPHFVHREPVELATLTAGLLDRARAMGDRRWVLDDVADGWTEADPQRLTQAVLNLLRNAVEHTADGDEIGLGTTRADGELRLWVRDRGPGVPVEDRAHLFDRFHRGATARRRSEGAGLGLAIVAAIAAAHDGRVELDCPPEGGSTFTIVLPAVATGPNPTDAVAGADDPTQLDPRTEEPTWPGS